MFKLLYTFRQKYTKTTKIEMNDRREYTLILFYVLLLSTSFPY